MVDWEGWWLGGAEGVVLTEGLGLIVGKLETEGTLLNVGDCEGWRLGVSAAEGC